MGALHLILFSAARGVREGPRVGRMDPNLWGPACWRLMFAATFKLPRARCLALFDALRYLLPCVHCRRSYRHYLERFPPELAINASPEAAARFAWVVKDSVNGKLGASALPFSVHSISTTAIVLAIDPENKQLGN